MALSELHRKGDDAYFSIEEVIRVTGLHLQHAIKVSADNAVRLSR